MGLVQVIIDDSTDKIITGTHTFDRDNGGIFIGGSGTIFPGTPETGEWFWRTDEAKLYRYSGSVWEAIASAVAAHAASHQDGGADEIDVAGLSGVLADKQDADKLQGQAVDPGVPTDKQIFQWNSAGSVWELSALLWAALTGAVEPTTDGDAVRLYHSDGVQYVEIGRTSGNFHITVGGTDAQAAYLNCKHRQVQLGGSSTAEKWAVSNAGDSAIVELYGDKTAKFFGSVTHEGNVFPEAANTRSLGSNTLRWKDVFVQTEVRLTSGGVGYTKYENGGIVGVNTGIVFNGGMSLTFKIGQVFGRQAVTKFVGANATQRNTVRAYYGTGSGGTYVQLDHDGSDGIVACGAGNLILYARSRIIAKKPLDLRAYTVAGLPSASPAGQLIYVSDESGGAVLAFSDGTNWRRVTDRAVVS